MLLPSVFNLFVRRFVLSEAFFENRERQLWINSILNF